MVTVRWSIEAGDNNNEERYKNKYITKHINR